MANGSKEREGEGVWIPNSLKLVLEADVAGLKTHAWCTRVGRRLNYACGGKSRLVPTPPARKAPHLDSCSWERGKGREKIGKEKRVMVHLESYGSDAWPPPSQTALPPPSHRLPCSPPATTLVASATPTSILLLHVWYFSTTSSPLPIHTSIIRSTLYSVLLLSVLVLDC
jgi:hypothetical protein